MEARVISGTEIRDTIKKDLTERTARLARKPALAIIQIGDNPESDVYVKQKMRFGEEIGCEVTHILLAEGETEEGIIEEIRELNADERISGIIVQLPLPEKIDADRALAAIDPAKDVDGLTPASLSRLLAGDLSGFIPATTKAVLKILEHAGQDAAGKRVTVVGRSNLVGKPTALALLALDATVTVCHSKTEDLAEAAKQADILIVAAGKKHLIGREHVRDGQIVIDVGITAETGEDGKRKLYGDVDFDAVKDIVAAITPVPGGVGPLTVASLFENVVRAQEFAENK
jgi:methylenetetrahydrofolate dehydrogenase (NADP+)/methenyltetrahydrofolate cyclohydrolase